LNRTKVFRSGEDVEDEEHPSRPITNKTDEKAGKAKAIDRKIV